MEKFIIKGGKKLKGHIHVSGSKNVALKALVAACLTEEKVVIENIPLISDFFIMVEIIKELGGEVIIRDHTVEVQMKKFKKNKVSLDKAAVIRTSSMFLAPLLAREGQATIPNPGGCRLGARPIDRVVVGLSKLGAQIVYKSKDGYFHAKLSNSTLHGASYRFDKNTHTGTETLILAAVLAKGTTILENAAEELEIDQLISLLNQMGARIQRSGKREITIVGVEKLHGTTFSIATDRNEVVTFAIAAIVTGGDVFIRGASREALEEFLVKLDKAGGGYEEKKEGIRFYAKHTLRHVDVVTSPHPGFMTDWQAPWAVLMTQAEGTSIIHETVFENKFGYVYELRKMGARISFFNPQVTDPNSFYNFNLDDDDPDYFHAIRIHGRTQLHDAVLKMIDLRAGAAVVIAALAASGNSTIFGIDKLDRGYEKFEERLKNIGAMVERIQDE